MTSPARLAPKPEPAKPKPKPKSKPKRTRGSHAHEWEPYKPLSVDPEVLAAVGSDDVVCVICDLLHTHTWIRWGADPRFARCSSSDCAAQKGPPPKSAKSSKPAPRRRLV